MSDDCANASTALLRIRSDPRELAAVRDRIREASLASGFDEQDAAKIVPGGGMELTMIKRSQT